MTDGCGKLRIITIPELNCRFDVMAFRGFANNTLQVQLDLYLNGDYINNGRLTPDAARELATQLMIAANEAEEMEPEFNDND